MIRLLSIFSCLIFCGISGAQPDSMNIEGYTRNFDYIKPADLEKGASLVFVLHGSGGNGKSLMSGTKHFITQVSNENVILVYPTGYKNYWNECRKEASSEANKLNINEQAFFKKMIDYFKQKFKINTNLVFAVGTSGGGHMCYKLAMTMPESIKAITAIIANLPDTNNLDCADAKKALPVMIVNGTADPTNPYEGGYMGSPTFKMGNVRSTARSFSYWSSLAGYTGSPSKTTLPDKDPHDGKIIEQYTYKSKGKPEITLLKVIGGKHDYPGDIDVHVEAWEFFKRCK
ncbi:MAG: poly(3-hydroxybutyrate) depolymerase [Saprospiraceae bacterium]